MSAVQLRGHEVATRAAAIAAEVTAAAADDVDTRGHAFRSRRSRRCSPPGYWAR